MNYMRSKRKDYFIGRAAFWLHLEVWYRSKCNCQSTQKGDVRVFEWVFHIFQNGLTFHDLLSHFSSIMIDPNKTHLQPIILGQWNCKKKLLLIPDWSTSVLVWLAHYLDSSWLVNMSTFYVLILTLVVQSHGKYIHSQNLIEMKEFETPVVKPISRVAIEETPAFTQETKGSKDKLLLKDWMVSYHLVNTYQSELYTFTTLSGSHDAEKVWGQKGNGSWSERLLASVEKYSAHDCKGKKWLDSKFINCWGSHLDLSLFTYWNKVYDTHLQPSYLAKDNPGNSRNLSTKIPFTKMLHLGENTLKL